MYYWFVIVRDKCIFRSHPLTPSTLGCSCDLFKCTDVGSETQPMILHYIVFSAINTTLSMRTCYFISFYSKLIQIYTIYITSHISNHMISVSQLLHESFAWCFGDSWESFFLLRFLTSKNTQGARTWRKCVFIALNCLHSVTFYHCVVLKIKLKPNLPGATRLQLQQTNLPSREINFWNTTPQLCLHFNITFKYQFIKECLILTVYLYRLKIYSTFDRNQNDHCIQMTFACRLLALLSHQ